MQPTSPIRSRSENSEDGFLLVAMICAVALVLIFLAVAAPIVAKDLQREREIEMIHRGNQYVRAIRLYYNKNGSQYPPSMDVLVQSNNIRYLRKKYVDPMTGKDDWRIIHVGENKTQVTGYFGEPLSGLTGPGGIGGAGGPVQTTGGATGTTGTTGSTGSTGNTGSTGSTSNDASTFNGGGGGPIMGVSSLSPKTSIISIHGQTTYDTWEFIYDPRIELLYQKSKLTGGGGGNASPSGP